MSDHKDVLRRPFLPEQIGKLPRITCRNCSDSKTRVCDKHAKRKCRTCGNHITAEHTHLDYVGHAHVTERLLEADPSWTWEPIGATPTGIPSLDSDGGLWIRLTVNGVTRPGYGDAAGKRGGNAVKEAIGDALRNAAMRFGVALDLWKKEAPSTEDVPSRQVERVEQTGEEKKSEVRGQIALISRNQGREIDEAAADFVTWSRGTAISSASLAQLVDYRDYLQRVAK